MTKRLFFVCHTRRMSDVSFLLLLWLLFSIVRRVRVNHFSSSFTSSSKSFLSFPFDFKYFPAFFHNLHHHHHHKKRKKFVEYRRTFQERKKKYARIYEKKFSPFFFFSLFVCFFPSPHPPVVLFS